MLLLGSWLWYVDGDEFATGHWGPPPLCHGAVDLASAAQIAAAEPGQPRGVGLFDCAEIPPGWDGTILSTEDARDARTDGKTLDAWESLTGYRPAGETIVACLWDHLTSGADPENLDACGVLMPDHKLVSTLWLGMPILKRPFRLNDGSLYSAKVMQVLTRDLARSKEQALSGLLISPRTQQPEPDYHLKIADAIAEKYSAGDPALKADVFDAMKPASFDAGDTLQPHETVLTESWTHADGTAISADQTWTEVTGDLQIAGNAVQIVSTSGDVCHARAEADLSSADQYCQLAQSVTSETTTSRNWAPCVRYASGANTCYHGKQFGGSSGLGIFRPAKNIAGTMTNLGTGTSGVAQNSLKKITCSGSTIAVYSGGVLQESITDTAIDGSTVGGRRGGIFLQGRLASWLVDNWEAGDLVTGGPFPHFIRRCLLGGMAPLLGGIR